jgi:hypothetical protein
MTIPPPATAKPGIVLLVCTTLLVLLNMWLAFAKDMRATKDVSGSLGAATAQLVIPVIVATLFSIGKRFRDSRSRTKVVLWTSLVLLVAALGGA